MGKCPPLCCAFVHPLGVDTEDIIQSIRSQVLPLGYETHLLKASCFLPLFEGSVQDVPVHLQQIEKGNRLCEARGQKDALARLLAEKMTPLWQPGSFILLQSVKRPEEIDFLRQLLGESFFLLALSQDAEMRRRHIMAHFSEGLEEDRLKWAQECMYHDERGGLDAPYGQHVLKAFSKADVYLNLNDKKGCQETVQRFFKVLFSHPFVLPSVDEVAMSHAFTEKMRSGDTSRPVGAVLTTPEGHFLQGAYNEVPKAGGGVYRGYEDFDGRDWPQNLNTNFDAKKDLFYQVVRFLQEEVEGDFSKAFTDITLHKLKLKTNFMDILEYSRNVHAEMNLLMSCARLGVSTINTHLYSTTFPCHSCAKHIIAAGVCQVIYIDPFAKSRAATLFPDSISTGFDVDPSKVCFKAYMGISPHRYNLYSPPPREDGYGVHHPWIPYLKVQPLGFKSLSQRIKEII